MFLIDTNVISELRKAKSGRIHKSVLQWFENISQTTLFISVITVMELERGILLIERRDKEQGYLLGKWLNEHVLPLFHDRILSIDLDIAKTCAALHVPDPCSHADALIASTAIVHNMTVVTRNTSDFEAIPVKLLNPWVAN